MHRSWPAIVATIVFLAGLAGLLGAAVDTVGEFTYPLDDAYIHMGIARRFLATGTWGVNPGEFTSATSSPLWTGLLTLFYAVIGPKHGLALVLNGAAGVALLVVGDRALSRAGATGWLRVIVLAGVVVLTPLDLLAGMGMEHVPHALITVGIGTLGARAVAGAPGRNEVVLLGLLAAAAPMIRYESWFLLGPLALALLIARRWAGAATLVGAATASTVAYGAVSVAQGAYFVPQLPADEVGPRSGARGSTTSRRTSAPATRSSSWSWPRSSPGWRDLVTRLATPTRRCSRWPPPPT